MRVLVCDVECYPNAFMIGFKDVTTGKLQQFNVHNRCYDDNTIRNIIYILKNNTIVTFNGINYDIPMIMIALTGCNTKRLYQISKLIIEGYKPKHVSEFTHIEKVRAENGKKFLRWQIDRLFNIEESALGIDTSLFTPNGKINHIDLMNIADGDGSLKLYGARLNSNKLQDLPYHPHQILTNYEWNEVIKYNENDLDVTIELYNALKSAIDLRVNLSKEYGIDLRSKGNAGMGVIMLEKTLGGIKKPNIPSTYSFKYKAPDTIYFKSDTLSTLLHNLQKHTFTLDKYKVELPKWLKPIQLAGCKFKVGVGGLHSSEKSTAFIPPTGYIMRNCDVTSYYPHLIMQYGFTPQHINSKKMLQIGSTTYVNRVKAKILEKSLEKKLKKDRRDYINLRTLEKSTREYINAKSLEKTLEESLEKDTREYINAKTMNAGGKIILNGGFFGKMGERWSKTFDPKAMVHITLTGQLLLLQLIEQMDKLEHVTIVSANTDGIEYMCRKDKISEVEFLIMSWELESLMDMEHGTYKSLYARDVNNYVAVYDGYVKAKGVYAEPTLSKNIEYPIVYEAIREYLLNGTPLSETIISEKNIERFLVIRRVTGGACVGGVFTPNEEIDKLDKNGNIEYYTIPKFKRVKLNICEKTGDKNDYERPKRVRIKDKFGNEGTHTGTALGKVVRYYFTPNGVDLSYRKNGNKVPKATGIHPLMNLDGIRKPIDYYKYVELAKKHLVDLGVTLS